MQTSLWHIIGMCCRTLLVFSVEIAATVAIASFVILFPAGSEAFGRNLGDLPYAGFLSIPLLSPALVIYFRGQKLLFPVDDGLKEYVKWPKYYRLRRRVIVAMIVGGAGYATAVGSVCFASILQDRAIALMVLVGLSLYIIVLAQLSFGIWAVRSALLGEANPAETEESDRD